MKLEDFKEAAATGRKMVEFLLAEHGQKIFDQEKPICLCVVKRSEPAADGRRFDFVPLSDKGLPAGLMLMMFKKFLQTQHENPPSEGQILAGAILSAGWGKDPLTGERNGEEVYMFTMEDPDRHSCLVSYLKDQSGGPAQLKNDRLEENTDYKQHGGCQNLYELPPLEAPEQVN